MKKVKTKPIKSPKPNPIKIPKPIKSSNPTKNEWGKYQLFIDMLEVFLGIMVLPFIIFIGMLLYKFWVVVIR